MLSGLGEQGRPRFTPPTAPSSRSLRFRTGPCKAIRTFEIRMFAEEEEGLPLWGPDPGRPNPTQPSHQSWVIESPRRAAAGREVRGIS